MLFENTNNSSTRAASMQSANSRTRPTTKPAQNTQQPSRRQAPPSMNPVRNTAPAMNRRQANLPGGSPAGIGRSNIPNRSQQRPLAQGRTTQPNARGRNATQASNAQLQQAITGWPHNRQMAGPGQMITPALTSAGVNSSRRSGNVTTSGRQGRRAGSFNNNVMWPNNYQGSRSNTSGPFYNSTVPSSPGFPTGRPINNPQTFNTQPPAPLYGRGTVINPPPPLMPTSPTYYPGVRPGTVTGFNPSPSGSGSCQNCGNHAIGCTTIARFSFNGYKLKKHHKSQIKELASKMITGKINMATVTGHTDSSGTEEYNDSLGFNRAATVVKALRYELSVLVANAHRMVYWRIDSKGETQPISQTNAANNRRVEVCLAQANI